MARLYILLVLMTLLLALTRSEDLYTGRCRSPKPMRNFSMERFSGFWFDAAFDVRNPEEDKQFENSRCGLVYFHMDIGNVKPNSWLVDIFMGPKEKGDLGGTYSVPDPDVGVLELFNKAGNFTYQFTVMCTDYINYLAGYSCAQVTPDKTSEFVLLMVRDLSVYDDVVAKGYMQRCFKDVTSKPVRDIHKRPYYNCYNYIH